MDLETALEFVDSLVFSHTQKHLTDLQRVVFEASWSPKRISYDEIAESVGYTPNYIKQDTGPKLWRLLSTVLGEKVSKKSFKAAIERQWQLHEASHSQEAGRQEVSYQDVNHQGTNHQGSTYQDPLAPVSNLASSPSALTASSEVSRLGDADAIPSLNQVQNRSLPSLPGGQEDWDETVDTSYFYGRVTELEQLQTWVETDRCRLLAILGLGGMGKTALAAKLARQLRSQFSYIVWRSLRNAPQLNEMLADLLQVLNQHQESELPGDPAGRVQRLIRELRTTRCLLILDNTETILRSGDSAGHYQEGYEDYGELFTQLGVELHQSCVILTSREKPKEIALSEGPSLPVRSLQLKGLEIQEGQSICTLKGTFSSTDEEWQQLVERYDGNPLALKIVSTTIQELFDSDISEFLRQGTVVFDDLGELLDQQFNRLSELEQSILYWLAIKREPTGMNELSEAIVFPVPRRELLEAIKSLGRRSLIEASGASFALQSVVMEYVTDRLIQDVCSEIETGDIDRFNRHSLIEAQAKEYLRNTQIAFILRPIADKLRFQLKRNVAQPIRQLLETLRNNAELEPGYAAGNAINLLCHLNINLKGENFSHLTIWQAYLQTVNLHDVDFTGSDLSKSVFAQRLTSFGSVAFHPDGDLLVTGDASGETRLWQVADGRQLLDCKGHSGWVRSVTFNPDGTLFASASSDQTVRVWQVEDGKCVLELRGHTQWVRAVAFSPDGQYLASGSGDHRIKLWDAETGECLKTLEGHVLEVWSVAFSPDGTHLASGSEDRTIKLWDVASGTCEQTLEGHTLWVRSIAFSPDGQQLVSGGGDNGIKLWDRATGTCIKTLKGHSNRIRSVVFSPEGDRLASGSGDYTVKLWNVETGQCLKTLYGHSNRLESVAFSPDGTMVASVGGDRTMRLWHTHSGQCLRTLQGYATWVQSVAFSPDGLTLASGSEDHQIRLWNLETGECQRTIKGHKSWVCSIDISPDGKTLASGSTDYSIKFWDTTTGQCRKTIKANRWIRAVAFSGDGAILASGSGDHKVNLWHAETGERLQTLAGHTRWVWSVAFSADSQTVVSGSYDQTVRVWSAVTGECLHILQGHSRWVQAVAICPHSRIIASGGCDNTIRLWDRETGDCLATLEGHQSWIQSLGFSPDGTTLASGSCDHTIKLWNVETGECQTTLQGHTSWIWSVTFSPNGELLATGSQDETIKVWDLSTGQCRQTLIAKRPYEGMNITDIRGLTSAQQATLHELGAIAQMDL